MTPRFLKFIDFVLIHEGSAYETDPDDPGNFRPNGTLGGTKYGIDAHSHPTVDIRNLTKEEATKIYFDSYWEPNHCDGMSPNLGECHMDACVNCGAGRADRFLKACGGDGRHYDNLRADFYRRLADARAKSRKYLKGWLARVTDLNKYLSIA